MGSFILALSLINLAEIPPVTDALELPIPFYSGNLSVEYFRGCWDPQLVPQPGFRVLTPERIRELKRAGCCADVDYLTWSYLEREAGQWDWRIYQHNARDLKAAGLDYVPFAWLHFPPLWKEAEGYQPYVNLDTGRSIPQLSLWSPETTQVYDTFYRRLKEEMGSSIAWIRLAMPSEYGEIGYCAGYTRWLRPQPDAGEGYWCGDPLAVADFRRTMLERYDSLDDMNQAWGTAFATPEEVAPLPTEPVVAQLTASATRRQYWFDFLDWYNLAWENKVEELVGVVRRHFPETELVLSFGYASEKPCYGNDQSRYLALAGRLGVAAQTPSNVGHFPSRKVATACRLYGAPYYTEPPAEMTADQELDRMFLEIGNGTDCWFDYLSNLMAGRDHFATYGHLLGGTPEIEVALWHPRLDLWMQPDHHWAPATHALAEPLRDVVDYEVVDDRMIRDDGLSQLGTRALILAGAEWLDGMVWRKVLHWVR